MFVTVELKSLTPFTKCYDDVIEGMISVPTAPSIFYPVKFEDADYIEGMKIILQPDGTPWVEGNLFLLWRAKQHPKLSDTTLCAEAVNLKEFMNVMHDQGLDHLDFKGREFERPTYIFKAHFKLDVARGAIDAQTANNKIRSVVRYYRWKMKFRFLRPTKPPWKESIIWVTHTNRFGFARNKEVITTNLTFAKNTEESSDYIYDGGKLRPLDKQQQDAIIQALLESHNTEMLLVFLLALVSGMRIQTVLTIRTRDVLEVDAFDMNTYTINAGEDYLVDTKYDKKQKIQVPGWMHYRIFTYLQSERYLGRQEKALEREPGEQYVFLSRTGKPLYVSKLDKHKYKKHEKGSAVRKFLMDTLSPLLKSRGHNFTFSFHDLRASYGMNLVEERQGLLEEGEIGLLELIDFVKKRLHHSNSKTTMGYLDYRRINKLVHEADAQFQQHIIELLERD